MKSIQFVDTAIVTRCLPNKLLHPNLIVTLPNKSVCVIDFMFEGVVLSSETKFSTRLEPQINAGRYDFLNTPVGGWDLLDELLILDNSFRKRKELNLSLEQLRQLVDAVIERHPDLERCSHLVSVKNILNKPELVDADVES